MVGFVNLLAGFWFVGALVDFVCFVFDCLVGVVIKVCLVWIIWLACR